MANPNFPIDGQGERIDALVTPTGAVRLKAAIGDIAVAGADDDSSGHLVGTHTDAAAAGANDPVVVVAGENGTTVKHLLVDANGNLFVVGKDAVGGAPTVNPLAMAGSDGTNLQYLRVDANGRLQVTGSIAAGSAAAGNPVLDGWSDGTNVRIPRTDANGYPTVVEGAYTDAASTFFASRTANTFKTANTSASGNTAIWTPTSGKKFRLLKFLLEVTADAAASGGVRIILDLRDASTVIGLTFEFWAPSASVTTTAGVAFSTGWVDVGPGGYLSGAANNALNLNLSAALTAGKARLTAIGTEE